MIAALLAWLLSHPPGPWIFPVLGCVSFVETVFPPFPGDVLFIVLAGWASDGPAPAILCALAGFAGCLAATVLIVLTGRRLGRTRVRGFIIGKVGAERLEKAEGLFRRRSRLVLAASRFIPGVRSLVVLVAGYSGMDPGAAILFGGASAMAWYAVLSAAGALFGSGMARVEIMMRSYELAVWAAILALAAALLVRRLAGGRR